MTAKQCIAARGKAKHDKRYAKLARKDAGVRAAKLAKQLEAAKKRKK